MRPALAYDQPLDLRAANRAGLSLAVVHPEIILEFAAAIDPVNGRAVAADAFLQNLTDRFMQRLSLLLRHRIRHSQRMQFRDVQRLVRVDVAQPGKEALVEEQGLELAAFLL